MTRLTELTPSSLWYFFEQICAIPHPSKHEQQLSTWIKNWASAQQLTVKEDSVGNLIIKKPATSGMTDKKGIILQAHMDMVPQKNNDCNHNFLTDPIVPRIIEDNNQAWVTATNTTLGADNGIGLASALAILASDDIAHGPLEVLITIDEEAGMTGAFGLEAGYLDGDILINTDSEEEGDVYMGCAGGIDGQAVFPLSWQSIPENYQAFNLALSGLKGGHSGVDINTGRGNANKLLVAFLLTASEQFSLQLTQLNGGSLRNAIPREADASFVIASADIDAFKVALGQYLSTIKASFLAVEPDICLQLMPAEEVDQCWTLACQEQILHALNACPNGVMRMSDDIAGVVESSLNLGVLTTAEHSFTATTLIRSLNDYGQAQVQSMVSSVFSLANAKLSFSGGYPGWQPNPNSAIMHTVRESYQSLFGSLPKIMVIHAGLECGLFKQPYPHWDMVSFGPTIKYPHSPDEKALISSVEKYWQLLLAVLANAPEK